MKIVVIFLSLFLFSCEAEVNVAKLNKDERACFNLSNEADAHLKGLPDHFGQITLTRDILLVELNEIKNTLKEYSDKLFDCHFLILNKNEKPADNYVKKIISIKNKTDSALSILEVYEGKLKNSSGDFDLEGFSYRLEKMLHLDD